MKNLSPTKKGQLTPQSRRPASSSQFQFSSNRASNTISEADSGQPTSPFNEKILMVADSSNITDNREEDLRLLSNKKVEINFK